MNFFIYKYNIDGGGTTMIKVKELAYPLNALEPYYNQETLDIHYNILYKGYVDNTNKNKEKIEDARLTNDLTSIKCL